MRIKPFRGSRALRRELERISERMDREGGIPHAVIVQRCLDEMARELKKMVTAYDGSPRKAKELLEAFLICEADGVPGVAELRRSLAGKLTRRKAA